MSDVSGIPYMGPMGQGNFFAPQFSYNPQINPTAGYAGPSAYGQGVLGQVLQDTQRSQQYTANLITSAAMAMPNSPGGAYMFSDTGGPAASRMPSFDTGPGPFGYTSGGASAIDLSRAGNLFSGGLSSGGGYSGPSIDWSNIGNAAANLKQDPYPGMSMPGGLGSPSSAPSGAGAFNWSDLWGGNKSGGSMPSIQSPSTDYGTFQGGGASGYSSGIAPDTSGGRDFEWPTADPAPGMAMPGGLGSPMTTMLPAIEVDETSKDQAPFDLSGPTAGWNNAPAAMPSSEQLLGYDPQQGPAEPDWSLFQSPATNYDTFQAPAQGGGQDPYSGDKTADQIANEARDRLAGIIGSPETAKALEEKADERVPLPRERPAGAEADALRPSDRVDTSMPGKKDALETLRKELQASGLTMTSSYRGPEHPLSRANPNSAHSQGLAFDTRAHTTAQGDAAMGQIRELMGARGLVEGKDYRIIDEVRNPSGHATAPHIHTQLTEAGMQKYQQSAYDVGAPRPPADIPPQGPLPPEQPQELPEGTSRPPMSTPISEGDIPLPTARPAEAPGPTALAPAAPAAPAAPVKHSGLELARANIDTPIEKIAMERGGQKAVDQVSSMAIGMTPRQLLQSYGGMFMSRAEPLFGSLGITRQDFEKAVTMPPTRQDLKMRFGEGGNFGPYPAYTGPEAGPGNASGIPPDTTGGRNFATDVYSQFRRSDNVEDRRALQMTPEQLQQPMNVDKHWAEDAAPVSDNPLSRGLGSEDLSWLTAARPEGAAVQGVRDIRTQMPSETSMQDFKSPSTDYDIFQKQPFIPPWQASIPADRNSPALRAQIEQTSSERNFRPEAIAGVINTEDPKYNPRLQDPDSSYYGLTQMGPQTFREAGGRIGGMTWEEFQRASPEQQVATYGAWLDYHGSLGRAAEHGVDISTLPAEAQAALLQGFQFAPYAGLNAPGVRDWLTPYAQGDASMATTLKRQAPFLNEHPDIRSERPTMGSMTDYYRRLLSDQVAGAERRFPQQQLFNEYYPTQMPFARGR